MNRRRRITPWRWSKFRRGCRAVKLLYGGATVYEAARASYITWAECRALALKHGLTA